MGCTRICLKEKGDVLNYICSISNDVMINNLISDLVNRDGVTNFFCNDDGSYSFSLINDKREKVYILFDEYHIFVSNNLDGIRQQVNYQIKEDGKFISVSNFSKIMCHNNVVDRTVVFESEYDCYDNLVFERKTINTNDSSNDCYENSCSVISKYLIDDVFVRINCISYDNNPDMDSVSYYVSDDFSWIRITEDEFNDRFIDKINKRGLQKRKSMV